MVGLAYRARPAEESSRMVRACEARGCRAPGARKPTLTLFEGDRGQIERDEEVFEEVLNHADLVVQAMVALQKV